jgi:hypothetical protein
MREPIESDSDMHQRHQQLGSLAALLLVGSQNLGS